jgi:putative FmdB family regulatory protein
MTLPLYEYECPACGRFERVQKFSDPLLTRCPTCGKPVEKLLSAPAIQFKGTGWYVTDYAGKSSGKDGGDRDKGDKKDAAASGADKAAKDSGGTKDPSGAAAKSADKTKSSDKA